MIMNVQTFPAMLAAAAMLAACASAPEPVTPAPDASARPDTATSALPADAVPIAQLAAEDPGIIALAAEISGASLVSFAFPGAAIVEDSRLKAALTEALVERHGLGLVILDTPCGRAAILDTYIAGAQTADTAAETLRAANIEPELQTSELAELMTWLRGWNAVFTDAPVRIAGRDCPLAETAEPGRMAIFWGYSFHFAHTGEKNRALAVRGDLAGGTAVWLVQDYSDGAEASYWVHQPARPSATWPGDTPSVDILVHHPGMTHSPGL